MKYFLRCNHNGKTVISFSGLSKEQLQTYLNQTCIDSRFTNLIYGEQE